jgi:hypothetical protein
VLANLGRELEWGLVFGQPRLSNNKLIAHVPSKPLANSLGRRGNHRVHHRKLLNRRHQESVEESEESSVRENDDEEQ